MMISCFLCCLCRLSRSCRTTPSYQQPAVRPPNWERLCPHSACSSTESTHISEHTHTLYTHVSFRPILQKKQHHVSSLIELLFYLLPITNHCHTASERKHNPNVKSVDTLVAQLLPLLEKQCSTKVYPQK